MSSAALPGWRFLLAAATAVGLSACGDGGGTELGTPPTSMVPISMPVDTVVTGEATDPPVSVRVEDALGNAVEGAPVRFVVVRGEGSVSPGVSVSGDDGVAESVFRAGPTPGDAEVRADIPSAPNVAPLQFRVRVEAADSVLLSVVEGDGQRAEVGSQLPLPFVLVARTPAGTPAGGVEVTFRIEGGRGQATLTNEGAFTDADGRVGSVLTLGGQTRDYRVTAFAGGGVYSDTVAYTATATAAFEGSVALDSVSGGGLTAGTQATLFGAGFSPTPAGNDVRIEGVRAEVLSTTATQITIRVPSFAGECLPAREVGVRVLVDGEPSNGALLPLEPSEPVLDLEVGEAVAVRGAAAVGCLQLPASEAPREYRILFGNASRIAGERLPMRVVTRVPVDLDGPAASASAAGRPIDPGLAEAANARSRSDVTIRTRTLQGLARGRVAPARARAPAAVAPAAAAEAVGDTVEYTFATQSSLTASCSDTSNVVQGVVRAAGEHVVLVEDLAAPPGGLNASEWTALGTELDEVVFPVDTAYFGNVADIDGNGRVIVLFTPEVNGLAEGESGVGGFFLPLDLAAAGGGGGVSSPGGTPCPASNEAEIVYIITADPEGRVGPVIDKARALRNARGLFAHELQHLISAERRVLLSPAGFAAAEEVWLDEALSQLAEEVVGLATIGLGVGGNYGFGQVANTRAEFDAFNTYHLNNFLNLSLYMFDPAAAPVVSGSDPGGAEGLQMRGFGWFLLRWLADQSSGDERSFFRSLVGGGQDFQRGIANLERASGREWASLLSDFGVALATDDGDVEDLPSRFEITTWDFRDVFASLSQNAAARSLFPVPFPLRATGLGFETASLEFDVGASGVRYFALASGLDAPPLAVALRAADGGPLDQDTEPQVTIVRTR